MTSHQAQLQALITEIESLLGKATPKLPWVTAGDAGQQRHVLEQSLAYLKELEGARTVSGGWSRVEGDQAEAAISPLSSPALSSPDRGEVAGQQVLQALLQEIQFLRTQTIQPLTTEVASLQDQSAALKAEIRQLELERAALSEQSAAVPNPAWITEVVEQMRLALKEQLTPQLKALQRQSGNASAFYDAAQMAPETATDLPQLPPQQRLEQLQHIQSQTDYLLLKLDSHLRAVFESMEQSIQSYCDSLSQGLNNMHGLSQQGEVIFRAFVSHFAEQFEQESNYLVSSEEPSARLLEGESSYDTYEEDDYGPTTLPNQLTEAPPLEALINFDDIDLDADVQEGEEITLFQLDEEITQLQLAEEDEVDDLEEDEDITVFQEDSAVLPPMQVTSPQDESTVIQTEPISWEAAIGRLKGDSQRAAFEGEAVAGDTAAFASGAQYAEEIDALYENLFGDPLNENTGLEEGGGEPVRDQDAGLSAAIVNTENDIDDALRQASRDLDGPLLPETPSEYPAPSESLEAIAEGTEAAVSEPAVERPALESLDLPEFLEAPEAAAADSQPISDPSTPPSSDASSSLGMLLDEEFQPEDEPSEGGAAVPDTIASLEELLPDAQGVDRQGSFSATIADDPLGDEFIPAAPDEDLLLSAEELNSPSLEVNFSLDESALEQLAEDLTNLEGLTYEESPTTLEPAEATLEEAPFNPDLTPIEDSLNALPDHDLDVSEADGEAAPETADVRVRAADPVIVAPEEEPAEGEALPYDFLASDSIDSDTVDNSDEISDVYTHELSLSLDEISLDLDLPDPVANPEISDDDRGDSPHTETPDASATESVAAAAAFSEEATGVFVEENLTVGEAFFDDGLDSLEDDGLDSLETELTVAELPQRNDDLLEADEDWSLSLDDVALDLDLAEVVDEPTAENLIDPASALDIEADLRSLDVSPSLPLDLDEFTLEELPDEPREAVSPEVEAFSFDAVNLDLSLDSDWDVGEFGGSAAEETTGAERPAQPRPDIPEDIPLEIFPPAFFEAPSDAQMGALQPPEEEDTAAVSGAGPAAGLEEEVLIDETTIDAYIESVLMELPDPDIESVLTTDHPSQETMGSADVLPVAEVEIEGSHESGFDLALFPENIPLDLDQAVADAPDFPDTNVSEGSSADDGSGIPEGLNDMSSAAEVDIIGSYDAGFDIALNDDGNALHLDLPDANVDPIEAPGEGGTAVPDDDRDDSALEAVVMRAFDFLEPEAEGTEVGDFQETARTPDDRLPSAEIPLTGSPEEGFSLERDRSDADMARRVAAALDVSEADLSPADFLSQRPNEKAISLEDDPEETAIAGEDEGTAATAETPMEAAFTEDMPLSGTIDLTDLAIPDFGPEEVSTPDDEPLLQEDLLVPPSAPPEPTASEELSGSLSEAEIAELFPPSFADSEASGETASSDMADLLSSPSDRPRSVTTDDADLFPASFTAAEEIPREGEANIPLDLSGLDALFGNADEENLEASFEENLDAPFPSGADAAESSPPAFSTPEERLSWADSDVPVAEAPEIAGRDHPVAPDTELDEATELEASVDIEEPQPIDSAEGATTLSVSQLLAIKTGDDSPSSDEPPSAPADLADEWFLGLDFGTSGLSAVLMNRVSGRAHPLYWTPSHSSEKSDTTFRLPAVARLQGNSTAAPELLDDVVSVGLVASTGGASATGHRLDALKPLLKTGIPYQTAAGNWAPYLQWSQAHTASLQHIFMAVQRLLSKVLPAANSDPWELGAVDLNPTQLTQGLQALQGVVVGFPSGWPDTYRINLREAVVGAGIVPDPGQVFFVEDAIAAILSGLPDPSEPDVDTRKHVQALYQCSWQGGTVVISAGATSTDLGLVTLPRPLDTLSREDYSLRNFAYGGQALDLDIIAQLLAPPERRRLRSSDSSASASGTDFRWRPTLPIEPDAQWDDLNLSGLTLPQLAEPDQLTRIQMLQHLKATRLGQGLLEAARYLKLTLQSQSQVHLELGDQRWKVLRRDLESRVLVPYIQRLSQHLNVLLSQTDLAAQSINQVICTGGNASFATVAKWLRQKFPNATIVQDTYPDNRPPSCSRVAYGLVNLCRYPQVLEDSRHQYSDYFLVSELMRVMPDQPMPVNGILHLLEEQGISVEACESRILSILEGHLPVGVVPDQVSRAHISEPTLSRLYQDLSATPLFTKQSNQIYVLNAQQRDRLQVYLAQLFEHKHQSLTTPLIAQLVVP